MEGTFRRTNLVIVMIFSSKIRFSLQSNEIEFVFFLYNQPRPTYINQSGSRFLHLLQFDI